MNDCIKNLGCHECDIPLCLCHHWKYTFETRRSISLPEFYSCSIECCDKIIFKRDKALFEEIMEEIEKDPSKREFYEKSIGWEENRKKFQKE